MEEHDAVERSKKKLARRCRSISGSNGGLTRSIGTKRNKTCDEGYIPVVEARKSGKLSAEEIMRLAGVILLQSYSQTVDGLPDFTQFPCNLSSSGGLSEQDIKNVRLAQLLLAAAEKISQRQYERADRLLDRCDANSDDAGNPVERVVFYFSEALRERIDRETGRVSDKGLGKKPPMSCIEATMMKHLSVIPSYNETPFPKITQFAGTQAIIENVLESKKIHIIHMGIPFASPWMLLMEALTTTTQLELLKITAVGKSCIHMLEETGKSLERFAKSKNLAFCYRIVMVSDFHDLKEELLEIKSDETVAVFSTYVLRTMLRTPDRLDHVMGIIARIAPTVTVIIENDANHNSPVFEDRFIEVLFFFSAYFDCLGECLSYDHDEKNRRVMERVLFGEWIRNMVAAEGDERKMTNVKIEVWRAFIERYGPKEVQFSMSSLYRTNLMLKSCPSWRHCMLEMNDKALVVCWKGVPMHFVSVWKFN